jgi:hypothetical protein
MSLLLVHSGHYLPTFLKIKLAKLTLSALAAKTPEEYVTQVSMSWSTDPQRAAKCIETYRAHMDVFPQTTQPS